jgi:adenylosuccinate synthase
MGSATKIGTTSRGIGPTYSDKMNRHAGIRVGDLLEFDHFQKKLDYNLETKADALQVGGVTRHVLLETYYNYAERIAPYVTDTVAFMHETLAAEKRILFEGAQGTMLDIDFGTYPYVTSSNCTAGAVCTGLGIGPKVINEVLGVSKAYVTRVGGGPFPTEMPPDLDEEIRKIGKEYGATTQRPRRCGWLDLVALRYATQINGLTAIALTKLDVFDTLADLQVCVAYHHKGKETTSFPSSLKALEECEPVYETLPGWQQPLTQARSAEDIPQRTKAYIKYVADYLNVPIPIISVGPDRDQIVPLGDPLW